MRNSLTDRWLSIPPLLRLGLIILVVTLSLIALVRYSARPLAERTQTAQRAVQVSQGTSQDESRNQSSSTSRSAAQKRIKEGSLLIEEDEELVPSQPKGANLTAPLIPADGRDTRLEQPTTQAVSSLPTVTAGPPSLGANMQELSGGEPPIPAIAKAPPPATAIGESNASVLDELPSGALNSPVKLAHYRFSLASTAFETNPTKQNGLERVAALERLTQIACMRKMLNTLSYRSPPDDPLCHAAIEKLLALNPGSTSAICSRDGIDSPSCIAADGDTTTRELSSGEDSAKNQQSSTERFSSLKERLEKNIAILRSSSKGISEEHRVTARVEATEVSSQILTLACATTKLFVRDRPVVKVRDFGTRKDSYGLSDLLEMQERHRASSSESAPKQVSAEGHMRGRTHEDDNPPSGRSPKPTPEKRLPSLGLLYLVSPECSAAISTARSIDPSIPALVCAERGRYSPRCIQAIRAIQATTKRADNDYKVGEDEAFSRF